MNTVLIANEKSVDEFVVTIRESLQSSNKAWATIAAAFAEAKDMYGFTSDRFKQLCKATNFSASTASKLASISTSDRLNTYAAKLSAVQSWGTLYAISALSEPHFAKLVQVYKLDDTSTGPVFLTQANVDAIRKDKSAKSPFKNYSLIKIDEQALKGELITADDLSQLANLMDQIAAISPYITVNLTNIDEKDAAQHSLRITNKANQVTRKMFLAAVNAYMSRNIKNPNETKDSFENRCLPMSRLELLALLANDPQQAFDAIGAQYDQHAIYNEAIASAANYANTYAHKVLSRVPSASLNPVNANCSGKKAA